MGTACHRVRATHSTLFSHSTLDLPSASWQPPPANRNNFLMNEQERHHPSSCGPRFSTFDNISYLWPNKRFPLNVHIYTYPNFKSKDATSRNHRKMRRLWLTKTIFLRFKDNSIKKILGEKYLKPNTILINILIEFCYAYEYINALKVWKISSQYLASQIMSDDISEAWWHIIIIQSIVSRGWIFSCEWSSRLSRRSNLLKIPRRSLERLNNC